MAMRNGLWIFYNQADDQAWPTFNDGPFRWLWQDEHTDCLTFFGKLGQALSARSGVASDTSSGDAIRMGCYEDTECSTPPVRKGTSDQPELLNTCLNRKRDDVLTGISATYIDGYSYQHKEPGQVSAAEWVMKPMPRGFQKRISFYISEEPIRSRAGQVRGASVSLLQDLPAWIQAGPMRRPETAALDGYARMMTKKRRAPDQTDWYVVDVHEQHMQDFPSMSREVSRRTRNY